MAQSTPADVHQPFTLFHVEICLKDNSTARQADIKSQAYELLCSKDVALKLNESNTIEIGDDFPLLCKNVHSFIIYCETKCQFSQNPTNQIQLVSFKNNVLPQHIFIHIFQLNEDEGEEDMDGDEDGSESNTSACRQWVLPSKQFQGLWDTLIFDDEIKTQLIDYVSTTLLFSDKHVDHNIVSWNRVVLLHGPPGTGKTSLCKALAQKLAVRMSQRYRYGQLIEINSHSLFSKWFSESGKLVMKLFAKIREMIEEKDCFVCILIDEVESLTAARKSALSGTEPSDAIRVVNAVLTQIDQLKNCDNALILTTSNITGAIDLAFVDRADIKQYIGLPSTAACYHILASCIQELSRVGIITTPCSLLDYRSLEHFSESNIPSDNVRCSLQLAELSKRCQGLSGRALRKLPFLAHAFFIQSNCTLDQFLQGLKLAVEREYKGRENISSA